MGCPFKHELRKDLETIPARMSTLPVDERGYIVPWFVDWIDGKPEFRALDPLKWITAVREKLCWVCGKRLGRYMTFVAGPMCGINRTSSEPPSHLECAQWSARNCPFLSNPEMIRRTDEKITGDEPCVGGFGLKRNPGVSMLWTTRVYDVFNDGKGGKLINMGEPESVEWWFRGRPATREEVVESVETGIPSLAVIAQQQEGGLRYLRELREKFEKFLPASKLGTPISQPLGDAPVRDMEREAGDND